MINTQTNLRGIRIVAVMLAIVLAFAGIGIWAVSSSVVNASAETLTGSGTAADPYLIGTKAQLETFRDLVNGGQTSICGKLTADIDLEGSESDQWTPIGIGTEQSKKYVGAFDGGGHKVSGLYIHSDENTSNRGFFGVIGGATIENLILKGQIMTSNANNIGGIAAFAYLQENVDSSGFTIRNCLNYVDVTGVQFVAGIVSRTSLGSGSDKTKFSSAIINCGNSGNITSTYAISANNPAWNDAYAAGILGNSNEYVTIENCYNTGDIQANCSNVGGIVGGVSFVSILNCYNTGAVTGYQRVGGIAGNWNGTNTDAVNTISFSNCHNVGTVTGDTTNVHSIIGINPNNNDSITGIYSLGTDTHKLSGKLLTADEMKDQANFEGWNFVNVWKMGRNYPVFGFKLAVGELTQSALLNGEETTTTVSNLNEETAATLLTEEELERFNDGESINVYLEVTTEKESLSIPAADKSVARTALSTAGAKEGAYLDLSLFKQLTNDEERSAIHESETSFDITIDIPADLAAPFGATRTYSIVRVHNGVAETLESTVADGKISFSTNKFSTYLIAYSDTFDANGEYIEFTSTVTGETTRFVDGNEEAPYGSVVVTYKMTHNDGFNSILLIPEYDTDVFAITSVSVNEEVLGEATITQGNSNTKKILLENTGDRYVGLDGKNEYFLTVTYSIIAAATGEYDFGLVLTSQGENTASVAYYIGEGESKGDQTQVAIKVIETNALTLVVKQDGVITIGGNVTQYDTPDIYEGDPVRIEKAYVYTYAQTAMTIEKVAETTTPVLATDFEAEYTYNGDGDVTVKWYYASYNGYGAYVKGSEIEENGTPKYPGYYYVGVSAAASNTYYAVEEVTRFIYIEKAPITVTIADKTSVYGEAIKALTSSITSGTVYSGDAFEVALSTTATASSNVGEYPITGSATNAPFYAVTFVNGTYTITKKAVTLTALDQEAVFNGSEPTVDQTKYTITGIANGELGVIITKAAGVHAGTYTLTPSIDLGNNYDVTVVTGIFTITTQGKNQEYIESFFTGLTKTYNGTKYDLLSVSANKPEWITYVAENNEQTNANDYTITITVTLTEQVAADYTDGEDEFVFTVLGKINKAAVTLSAVNVNVLYGAEPVVPSFTVDGTTEEIDYDYEIKDGDDAFHPAADTAVGVYDIVLIEGENPNFTVTYVDGTYTVSKATATVSAAANNVYYNRNLNNVATASVNTLSLTPVITYYTDSACTQETTPVDAGTYYVKAVVAKTDNYNGAEAVKSFEILPVKLAGVTFTYSHGNATWSAVTADIGKTSTETGVAAAALKEGTTISYKIYAGDTLIATQSTLTFDAAAATTYKVVAVASDANYISSESTMVAAYAVTFDEGEHLGNPDGEVTNMPATQYIFAGQTAVAPNTEPSVFSCTFTQWTLNETAYDFDAAVNGDITIIATWDAVTYTITLKYLSTSKTENTDVFIIDHLLLNATVSYAGIGVTPVKSSDNAGIYYTFANKWTDENSVTYNAVNNAIDGYTVQGDMTFVAVFDTNYNSFTVTYYLADGESTDVSDYVQVGEAQSVVYNTPIEYRPIVISEVVWFKIYGWYSNTERTAAPLTVMPAENISVYAGYVFDIGTGDVNGDGLINANDITLYRQWIVGGYAVIPVEVGHEWETASGAGFSSDNLYFLKKVADGNADDNRDIRDVSVTRMAIVGGYSWDIVSDTGVSGKAIVRSAPSFNLNAVANGLNTLSRARLYSNVTAEGDDLVINSTKNIYLDLKGFTLTVKSLTLNTTGTDATITVTNGTIIAENGITITAPNGNVVIEDVTAYVDGQPINLQAADSSLHFAGAVKFYDAEIIDGEINEFGAEPTAAPIHVEEGTHVVVEAKAEIVIEKIVVTENVFQVPVTPSETATITLDNKTETVVEVQGNTLNEISDAAGLTVAAKKGGSYVVTKSFTVTATVEVTADLTLDLNGYIITANDCRALWIKNGAVSIVGEGTISASGATLAESSSVIRVGDAAANSAAASLTIGADVTISSDRCYGVTVFGKNVGSDVVGQTLTVYGTVSVTGNASAISGNGNTGLSMTDIVIKDGAVISATADAAIYQPQRGTLLIEGGASLTGPTALYVKSGNVTVEDGAILTATKTTYSSYAYYGNGPKATGDAIVIDNCYYPGNNPTVTLGENLADTVTVAAEGAKKVSTYWAVSDAAQFDAALGAYASYIALKSDISLTSPIMAYLCDFTLDMNGHNITSTSNVFIVYYYGVINVVGTGTIETTGANTTAIVLYGAGNSSATGYASVTIGENVTVKSNDFAFSIKEDLYKAKKSAYCAELNVAGTIIANSGISVLGNVERFEGDVVDDEPIAAVAHVNVKGTARIYASTGAAIYAAGFAKYTVEEGAYLQGPTALYIKSGYVTVEEGATLEATLEDLVEYTYSSGGFTPTGDAIVIDNCYYPGANASVTLGENLADTITVTATGAKKIAVYWYVTTEAQLREAFAAGGEIILGSNITVTGTEVADRLTITKDTTLDLNGKTLKSADGLTETDNWSTLWVNNGAVANVKNGTIGSCYDTDGTTDAPYGINVGVKNGTAGTLNLTNVNVYGGTTAVQIILGEVNIYSGTFAATPYENDYVYLINCYDPNYTAGTAVFNVYGGSFVGFDPANTASEPGGTTSFVAEGYEVTEDNGVYTVQAE